MASNEKGIDHAVFSAVLKFLYTGEVELQHPQVNELLLASVRCDIKVLKQKCEIFHVQHIGIDTVLEYLKVGLLIIGW